MLGMICHQPCCWKNTRWRLGSFAGPQMDPAGPGIRAPGGARKARLICTSRRGGPRLRAQVAPDLPEGARRGPAALFTQSHPAQRATAGSWVKNQMAVAGDEAVQAFLSSLTVSSWKWSQPMTGKCSGVPRVRWGSPLNNFTGAVGMAIHNGPAWPLAEMETPAPAQCALEPPPISSSSRRVRWSAVGLWNRGTNEGPYCGGVTCAPASGGGPAGRNARWEQHYYFSQAARAAGRGREAAVGRVHRQADVEVASENDPYEGLPREHA